ncbi:hypothetical protein P5V15_009251 [Pogonomyrmex californicus]
MMRPRPAKLEQPEIGAMGRAFCVTTASVDSQTVLLLKSESGLSAIPTSQLKRENLDANGLSFEFDSRRIVAVAHFVRTC